jgi:hypothetical protein
MRSRILLFGTLLLAALACSDDMMAPAAMQSVGSGAAGGANQGGSGDGGPGGSDASYPELAHSGSRLKVDGYRVGDRVYHTGIFDSVLATPCVPDFAQDGELRCLPSGGALVDTYADAGCTVPVVTGGQLVCATSSFVTERVGDRCGEHHIVVRELTASALPLTTIHHGGACTSQPASDTTTYYAVSRARPPGDFVAMSRIDVMRGDRLSVHYVVGEDGSYFVEQVTDDELDTRCFGAEIGGASVCVPFEDDYVITDPILGPFAAGDCSGNVVVAQAQCPEEPRFALQSVYEDGCYLDAHVYEVAEPLDTVHTPEGKMCAATSVRGQNHFAAGPEVPTSAMPNVEASVVGSARIRVREYSLAGAPILYPHLVDSALDDTRCTPVDFADGSTRCVPQFTWLRPQEALYADSECSERLGPAGYLCAGNHNYFIELATSCAPAGQVYGVGAPFEGLVAYSGVPGACFEYMGPADVTKFAYVGEPVPSLVFAELARSVD